LYTKGTFTVDELDGHEEYCCVCGEGGNIICCDFCNNSVCQHCIQRIAGKDYLDNLLECSDEKWKCFSCDTSFLRFYEQFYFQNSESNNTSKNCNNIIDIQVEDEEVEISGSLSGSDVSGIATDEVSMSDTELCNNTEGNHSPKYTSGSSDTSASKKPLCNVSRTKQRKRKLFETFLDSDDSADDMTKQHNKITLPSDSEREIIPVINDIDFHSPLNYTIRSDEECTSSDSDAIAPKKSRSSLKATESGQKSSANNSDDKEKTNVKWYSTRSKVYKGNELDNNAKFSTKKRKRRHVKVLSSESDSGPENQPMTPGRKRRKLRKLIDDDKLEAETRRAQKDEELRLKRIKEKEKHSKGEESDLFILESSGDIVIDVEPTIASHLRPHQRKGVKFLWDCCCENLDLLKSGRGSGAILAHCMGLGKSLQV